MSLLSPEKIYVEEGVIDHPLARKILGKLPSAAVVTVSDYKRIGEEKPLARRAIEDKRSIALARKKGDLIKTIGRMEDGEYYLFHEIDCSYDCEYCYLQYYFQTKVPVVFVNRDEVLQAVERVLKSHLSPYFHAGEVNDALALDHLTGFSLEAAALFDRYPQGTIEFRTKSTNVENLVSRGKRAGNIIPSWTLSPESVNRAIEHNTPPLAERLDAARRCQEAGFTVGLRLDPIIHFTGWENEYRVMVENIFRTLIPERIDYVSLGTPKMHKLLIEAVETRFPQSPIILGELLPSRDGKYRYLKFARVDIYKKMTRWIKALAPETRIDLSLESPEVEALVSDTS